MRRRLHNNDLLFVAHDNPDKLATTCIKRAPNLCVGSMYVDTNILHMAVFNMIDHGMYF